MVHENMIASVSKSQILTQVWELLDPFSDVTGVCFCTKVDLVVSRSDGFLSSDGIIRYVMTMGN